MATQEKKDKVIQDLRSELEQLLQTNIDKKTKTKVEDYIKELKNIIKNKDGLLNMVQQLETMKIIDVPDTLVQDIQDISNTITDDYNFWNTFISELSGMIFEIDDKLAERTSGLAPFFKKLCSCTQKQE